MSMEPDANLNERKVIQASESWPRSTGRGRRVRRLDRRGRSGYKLVGAANGACGH